MTPIDFSGFASTVFYGLLAFLSIAIVKILSDLNKNVHELNISIAVVLERMGHNEKDLDEHDSRLTKHEKRLIKLEENQS